MKFNFKILLCVMAAGIGFVSCSNDFSKNDVSIEKQRIELTGVANARELGGYKTVDGKTIKRGKILRTAALNKATDEDLALLKNKFNLKNIIDFRTSSEIASGADKAVDGAAHTNVDILGVTTGLSDEDYVVVNQYIAENKYIEMYKFVGSKTDIQDMYYTFVTEERS